MLLTNRSGKHQVRHGGPEDGHQGALGDGHGGILPKEVTERWETPFQQRRENGILIAATIQEEL